MSGCRGARLGSAKPVARGRSPRDRSARERSSGQCGDRVVVRRGRVRPERAVEHAARRRLDRAERDPEQQRPGADPGDSGVGEREVPIKLIDTVGTGRLFDQIPYLVIISLAVAVVFGIVLAATRFGRYTYAIGSNQEAARRAGVAVDRHLIKVYGLAGTLAGLAGFMNLARFSTTTIGGHDTDNLAAIAAVVIGGTSLFGGIGTVLGSLFGVFIPGYSRTAL